MHADLELLKAGRSVKRRQARQRILRVVGKFATAGVVLGIGSLLIYWLAIRPKRGPDFVWSKIEQANQEYQAGMRALHARGDSFEAIKHFQAATEHDPPFAEAYARLAGA